MDIGKISNLEGDFNTPRFLHLVHPHEGHPMYVTGKGGDENMALVPGKDPEDEDVQKIGLDVLSTDSDKFDEVDDRITEREYIAKQKRGGNLAKEAKAVAPTRIRKLGVEYAVELITGIHGFYRDGEPLDVSSKEDRKFLLTRPDGKPIKWILKQIEDFTGETKNFLDSSSSDTN